MQYWTKKIYKKINMLDIDFFPNMKKQQPNTKYSQSNGTISH